MADWLHRHEAAHCVAAMVYGASLRHVYLHEGGGRVDLDLSRLAPTEQATVYAAGAAVDGGPMRGADLRGFREAIARLPRGDRDEAAALAKWNAFSIADRNRALIENIATHLALTGRLTGREIDRLITAAMPHR